VFPHASADCARGCAAELAPPETPFRRRVILVAAMLACIGFWIVHHSYWVPANGGVDQNGYMVGGKQFAERLSTRFDPINPVTKEIDPFMFVGMMWIGVDFGTPNERYYPKYPIGMPVHIAIARVLGGPENGPIWAYYVNPIAMTLAMLGSFMLMRLFAGSFAALIGMLILMSGLNVLSHTNNPNSHATTVCCVAWGMFLLFRWWQSGGFARAAGAGFLLGYAVTIRYTEGLLCAAIAPAVLYRLWPQLVPLLKHTAHEMSRLWDQIRARGHVPLPNVGVLLRTIAGPDVRAWFERRPWLETLAVGAAWALPVGALVAFNLGAFGSLTGYDPSNESVGFSLDFLQDNWETLLRHMNGIGLFMIFPLGIVGLAWMFAVNWRAASIMLGWIVPNLAIYALYYWAPDGTHVGYLRFFLTIFPGLMACAMFTLARLPATMRSRDDAATRRAWGDYLVRPVMLGVLACVAMTVNLEQSLYSLENEQRGNYTLHRAAMIMKEKGYAGRANVPPGSVIFAQGHVLNHLQFAGDWVCYNLDPFNHGWVRAHAKTDPDEPQVFQPQRARFFFDLLKQHSDEDFVMLQQRKIAELLRGGRRVFFITPRNAAAATKLRLAPRSLNPEFVFETKTIAMWNDPNVNYYRRPAERTPRRQRREPPVIDPRTTSWIIFQVTLKNPAPPQD
jgi:hypothetical protein